MQPAADSLLRRVETYALRYFFLSGFGSSPEKFNHLTPVLLACSRRGRLRVVDRVP
jgi:hypothetical protein